MLGHLHHKDLMPGCWLPCPDASALMPRACIERAEAGAQGYRTKPKNLSPMLSTGTVSCSHAACPSRISGSISANRQANHITATGLGSACGKWLIAVLAS